MKCRNCRYGEPCYIITDDEPEPILLVKCPFGDQVYRFGDKRCGQFIKRKEQERRDGYDEKVSEVD